MNEMKASKGIELDTDFTTDDLKELVKRFKDAVKKIPVRIFLLIRGISSGKLSVPSSTAG